jgi:hypothetical protein
MCQIDDGMAVFRGWSALKLYALFPMDGFSDGIVFHYRILAF